MRRIPVSLTMLITAIVIFIGIEDVRGESTTIIPLRFHIVTDMSMQKNGLEMNSWINKEDIKNTVLPKINRI